MKIRELSAERLSDDGIEPADMNTFVQLNADKAMNKWRIDT